MHRRSQNLVLGTRTALLAFTALRIVLGVIMAGHGFHKAADPAQFLQRLDQLGFPLPGVFAYFAIAGELLGGLGLIVGLLTPVAAFGVAATMLVAILTVHWEHGLFAADGGFEFPLLLVVSAVWFMAAGGGPYSLDALLRAAREQRVGWDLPDARAGAGPQSEPASDLVAPANRSSFQSSRPAHTGRTH